jgi:hypothetical protein
LLDAIGGLEERRLGSDRGQWANSRDQRADVLMARFIDFATLQPYAAAEAQANKPRGARSGHQSTNAQRSVM